VNTAVTPVFIVIGKMAQDIGVPVTSPPGPVKLPSFLQNGLQLEKYALLRKS
jgi:hypothetical protein